MLDYDITVLYNTETRLLNQAVKRNIYRFPADFMFQLNKSEWVNIQYQSASTSNEETLTSQIVTSKKEKRGGTQKPPYAFTEHGVAILASVLKSEQAVKMNIAIISAFIALRKLAIKDHEILNQLMELRYRTGDHDVQLSYIYDALENMLDKNQLALDEKEKWSKTQRIGFKKQYSFPHSVHKKR
jgi:hypothetical protein